MTWAKLAILAILAVAAISAATRWPEDVAVQIAIPVAFVILLLAGWRRR
jgi:hypothetical protein